MKMPGPARKHVSGLPDSTSSKIRAAIRRHRSWALAGDLAPDDIATVLDYVTHLERTLEPARLYRELGYLAAGLRIAEPSHDWSWLQEHHRAAGRSTRQDEARVKAACPWERRVRHSLPIAEWPMIYVSRWQTAVHRGSSLDLFGEFKNGAGCLAHQSDAWRKCVAESWGMLFKHVRDTNAKARVDEELIETFIVSLKGRSVRPISVSAYLRRLYDGSKALDPGVDYTWLLRIAERQRGEARKQPKKKAGRVCSGAALLGVGLTLCAEASGRRPDLVSTAVQFRDGVIFALLAIAPTRVTAFANIEIGKHLDLSLRPGCLVFDAGETKQKRAETHSLTPEVRDLIDEYLSIYRHVLLDGYQGCGLWLARFGGEQLSSGGIRTRIKKHSLRYLGVDTTPHLFRDAVALTVSERAPDEMEVVTSVLRHGSASSTKSYRDQASTISAADIAQREMAGDRVFQKRRLRDREPNNGAAERDEVFARFA